jgi:hypothetical protein
VRGSNASRSLSLSIYSLIFFSTLLIADTYRIGYRAVVKDSILIDETLNISRSMTACYGSKKSTLTLNTDTKNVRLLLNKNSEKFYEYLLHQSLHVRDNSKISKNISTTLTILTFPTQCFKVTFKGNLAKITLIK